MRSPFLNAVADNMRMKHYAEKTIKAYVYWIKCFIYFNQKRHPSLCHNAEVETRKHGHPLIYIMMIILYLLSTNQINNGNS